MLTQSCTISPKIDRPQFNFTFEEFRQIMKARGTEMPEEQLKATYTMLTGKEAE